MPKAQQKKRRRKKRDSRMRREMSGSKPNRRWGVGSKVYMNNDPCIITGVGWIRELRLPTLDVVFITGRKMFRIPKSAFRLNPRSKPCEPSSD